MENLLLFLKLNRYLIEVNKKNKADVIKILDENSIYYDVIGNTQKNIFDINEELVIKLPELCDISSFWFKNYFKES